MSTNSLKIEVTRPDQLLIIMRGIPGAGKSTKAKSLVGEGSIHSTDEIIETAGDYRLFFETMIASGDFTPLHKAHGANFKLARLSMNDGISPIIIDNTNIKASEAKNYVLEALKLGYADDNISIVDVGTGNSTAAELAARNKHGVPLEKIEAMIQAYNSVGPLTLKKILDSKDMFKDNGILYSAVLLDAASKTKLFDMMYDSIPDGWTLIGHHMTIAFGKPVKDKAEVGKTVTLTVTHVGSTDKAMAVKVEGYETTNDFAHITVAINPDDATPSMSKEITKWMPIKQFILVGVVTEVKKGMKV